MKITTPKMTEKPTGCCVAVGTCGWIPMYRYDSADAPSYCSMYSVRRMGGPSGIAVWSAATSDRSHHKATAQDLALHSPASSPVPSGQGLRKPCRGRGGLTPALRGLVPLERCRHIYEQEPSCRHNRIARNPLFWNGQSKASKIELPQLSTRTAR